MRSGCTSNKAAVAWPTHTQLDTDTVLPYYSWLAKTGAFCENHCSGFGTNSTPNHLLIVGGQASMSELSASRAADSH